ncbi:unnamed protein product [Cylicostephanus goldi]|uniref:Uncharacterized protein n=1 Tax=Cylicostephanus goldi TaxID=71465 RepID=A0A3P7M2Y8_CYLGO|nr:unnamed protein product [Cylicostephanus goldi]
MPLMRYYAHDYRPDMTVEAPSRYGSLLHLGNVYKDGYYAYNPTYDLNRSVHGKSPGCSYTYRMNVTIHDPENYSQTLCYDPTTIAKKKKGRVRAALIDLFGRSSRRDLFRPDSLKKDEYCCETPKNGQLTKGYNYTPASSSKNVRNRAPSADAAIFLMPESNRERKRYRDQRAERQRYESSEAKPPRTVEHDGKARRRRSKCFHCVLQTFAHCSTDHSLAGWLSKNRAALKFLRDIFVRKIMMKCF